MYESFKKMIDDKVNLEYQLSENSVILKYFNSLMRLEDSNKFAEFEELRIREDELVYDPKEPFEDKSRKEKQINEKSKNKKGGVTAKELTLAKEKQLNNKNKTGPISAKELTLTNLGDVKSNDDAYTYKTWFLKESKKLLKPNKILPDNIIQPNSNTLLPNSQDKNSEEIDPANKGDSQNISFVKIK